MKVQILMLQCNSSAGPPLFPRATGQSQAHLTLVTAAGVFDLLAAPFRNRRFCLYT